VNSSREPLRALAIAAAFTVLLRPAALFAFGQLPLISEDPSSPCESTLDTSVAYTMDLLGPGHDALGEQEFRSHLDMSVPIVELNYGLTDRVQARVEGENFMTTVSPNHGRLADGFGDVTAGLKYRFMDQIDGLEDEDTCDPVQSEAPYGIQGPFSISVFPQFIFPTGSFKQGLGSGEYALYTPLDVARKFGDLYIIAEFSFLWRYHDRSLPNEIAAGLAAYYSITDQLDLLGEQRVDFLTSGQGATLWLMDVGAQYQITDSFAVFGTVGTSVAATSAVAPSNLITVVGVDWTLPVDW
jgi:outer membrane putative beta-barrel porin/alpha-amylase